MPFASCGKVWHRTLSGVALAIALAVSINAAGQVQYKVLWNFAGAPNDGAIPMSSLVFDKAGNLYGTTNAGGASTAPPCGGGCGTVFRLSQNPDGSWTNTTLYSLCSEYSNLQCLDGAFPQAGLVFDRKGNLYGTTKNGGGQSCPFDGRGCGAVFELSPPSSQGGAWTETVLHAFCTSQMNNQCLDGGAPTSQLALDASGSLYGTTTTGGTGASGAGTVFELSYSAGGWTETVLYTFCAAGGFPVCPDGSQPFVGVTFDKAGNLYGTTERGGSRASEGGGTVYKLSPGPSGWTETVLYVLLSPFRAGDGPLGTVSFGSSGDLFSTVSAGGRNEQGGLFRLSPKKGTSRTFYFDGQNGNMPVAGVLVDSKEATLYGSTFAGGTARGGTVFKIVAPAQETVLYNFCSQPNCADGGGPAGLIADQSGNLDGTGKGGGANNNGVVFEIIQQPPAVGRDAPMALLGSHRSISALEARHAK